VYQPGTPQPEPSPGPGPAGTIDSVQAAPTLVLAPPAPLTGITRWFVVSGALAIALFSAGMANLLTRFVESTLLLRDAELSRDFVQSVVDTQHVAGALRSGAISDNPNFSEFFDHLNAMPDVLRTNIYSTQRRLMWSSSPALVGRRFDTNDELEQALQGRVVAHFDDQAAEKAEHLLLESREREFVESYLPILDPDDGLLVAVVELYRRPVALTQVLQAGRGRIWLGALVGGVGLILSLLWFVHRIQRSLVEQQSRLVDSEALAMVGELSAAVAHSIRNPLVSIRSAAELQCELGLDAPLDPGEVIRHVDRIEHLVRTLLTCAGDPQQRLARCALVPALAATAARFGPECMSRNTIFETDWPEDLGEVGLDEILLAQALASVLSNAAEATRAGHTISLTAARQAGQAVITVEDDGPGIPAALRGHADQPFVTSKPRGLGLGLPLARRAMERAGGRLDITGRHPTGTRVTLSLPVLAAPTASQRVD
jgi:two-component system, NtrC family, sensor histidine kinase HydH